MPASTENSIKQQVANAKAGHGLRFDQGKLRYDLLPYDAIAGVTEVLTLGAEKYGERNWENGMRWMRCFGSLMRHMTLWVCGQEFDTEMREVYGRNISHLDLACANILFLSAYSKRGVGADDRVKTLLKPQRVRAKAKTSHLKKETAQAVESVQK